MKVKQYSGLADNLYFVEAPEEWYSIQIWMKDNDVDYERERWFRADTSVSGFGFVVLKRHYWFKMRWA